MLATISLTGRSAAQEWGRSCCGLELGEILLPDRFGVYERESAPREHVKTEVTASLSPFVGLFCKDRPDEPDDRVAVWEDPNNISAMSAAMRTCP